MLMLLLRPLLTSLALIRTFLMNKTTVITILTNFPFCFRILRRVSEVQWVTVSRKHNSNKVPWDKETHNVSRDQSPAPCMLSPPTFINCETREMSHLERNAHEFSCQPVCSTRHAYPIRRYPACSVCIHLAVTFRSSSF